MTASNNSESTPTHMSTSGELPGLHGRITILPAGPRDRAAVTEQLARLLARAQRDAPTSPSIALGPVDFAAACREAALLRVEDHERIRGELAAKLRRARELQAVTANRRDEAAARARRMAAHLDDCDALLERAGELTNAAEEARRTLDARRQDVETARSKLVLVEEQREAAAQTIDDAARQLRDLETSELDETTLRREVEMANRALQEAEQAHAEATDVLRGIQQAIAARAATRDHILYEREELVARLEAPLPDTTLVRDALAAFDAETRVGEPDLVARELAREWIEVDGELERIESALPEPPSADELAAAERRLAQLEQTIDDLESAGHGAGLPPEARDEIEAAHEAVLEAEEYVDQSGGHEDDLARLQEAREVEHAVLRRHGYETYLDVILADPGPDGDAQADLLDALRARRVAEDTVASLRAAAEPPAIVTTLHTRRDRIYREAAEMLGCDPGQNVAELLYAHPVVPPNRTRQLAAALAEHGIVPVGVSVREAAVSWLVEHDRELAERDECRRAIERLDRDLLALDDEDDRAREEAQRADAVVSAAHADVGATLHRVRTLEDELADRATHDERRLQRIAAAEQLRAQIAAVSEALQRSEDEYSTSLAAAESGVVTAEAAVERATAALADAVRRLRRISEALPPALRPRAGDDPLGELPRLRETLAAEVERAEVALASATEDLERARADIDDTQAQLDEHLAVVPTDDVGDEDLEQALFDLIGTGDVPAVLDDPFVDHPEHRDRLLEVIVEASGRRPVVLLTDDPQILGWAISLPDDVGAVTRLAAHNGTGAPTSPSRGEPITSPSGPVS
ncbi:MAG TPA: hypothetical protein VFZ77_23385 [Acidimicrobiales bacterium]